MIAVLLSAATLCEDCRQITDSRHSHCIACGSTALVNLARILEVEEGYATVPHGFKRDVAVTEAAYRNGIFVNPGSFFTTQDSAGRVHLHLEGRDRSAARVRCYMLSRGKCAVCKAHIRMERFEMHHPGHCDCTDHECPTHVEARCSQWDATCHRHRQEGFNKTAPKIEEGDSK